MKKENNISALEEHLGYWLRYVSNHVSHAFAQALTVHGATVAEWVVLRELYESDDVAPSTLAERLGMTRGAVSKLADRLAAKSLVKRVTGLTDRRFQSLSLTAAGRALVPDLSHIADQNDEKFFGHLQFAERQAMEKLLREIVQRLGLKTRPIN